MGRIGRIRNLGESYVVTPPDSKKESEVPPVKRPQKPSDKDDYPKKRNKSQIISIGTGDTVELSKEALELDKNS